MVTAIEYRAMALQHHRWASLCRSLNPERNTFAWKRNSSRLRIMKNACMGCVPWSRQVIRSS
jgi:hypothetical protein